MEQMCSWESKPRTQAVFALAERRSRLQFGSDFEGLATTKPAAAPGTLDPVEPILFSTPCNAIGLSEAMKLESEPVARSSCRRYSRGVAKEYCVKNVAVPARPARRDT